MNRRFNWLLPLTHVGALLPLAVLAFDFSRNNLTANPIREITLRTGKTALVLLILTLLVTPFNTLFNWKATVPLRRWFGLYACLYAVLHLFTFIGLDYAFDLGLIWAAVADKRYALVGFTALLFMLPLALTSTKGWQRRLGQRWKTLHRSVYLVGALAAIHFIWLVKFGVLEPWLYAGAIGLLLLARVPIVRRGLSRLRQGVLLQARPAGQRRSPSAEPPTPEPQPASE